MTTTTAGLDVEKTVAKIMDDVEDIVKDVAEGLAWRVGQHVRTALRQHLTNSRKRKILSKGENSGGSATHFRKATSTKAKPNDKTKANRGAAAAATPSSAQKKKRQERKQRAPTKRRKTKATTTHKKKKQDDDDEEWVEEKDDEDESSEDDSSSSEEEEDEELEEEKDDVEGKQQQEDGVEEDEGERQEEEEEEEEEEDDENEEIDLEETEAQDEKAAEKEKAQGVDDEDEEDECDSGDEEEEEAGAKWDVSKSGPRASGRLHAKRHLGVCPSVDDVMFRGKTLGYDVLPVVKQMPNVFPKMTVTCWNEKSKSKEEEVSDDDFNAWRAAPRHLWHETRYFQRIHRMTWQCCNFGHSGSDLNGQNDFCYKLYRSIMAGDVRLTGPSTVYANPARCGLCGIAGHPALPNVYLQAALPGANPPLIGMGRHCAKRLKPLLHLWDVLNHCKFYTDEQVLFGHIKKAEADCIQAIDQTQKYFEKKQHT